MHIVNTCKGCRRDALGRYKLNGVGLGASEYSGQKVPGGEVGSSALQIGGMIGKMTGAGLITSMVPQKVLSKIGIDVNPLSLSLAPFTFGFTLLPGVSKILGGLFKKATHMESCMNYWSDSNIKNMVAGIQPIPFDFVDYMKLNFPQFMRQYQILIAGGQWASVGVDKLLNISNRRAKIANIFLNTVRANPDIMLGDCVTMPQGIAEVGVTVPRSVVNKAWADLKEYARQKEYSTIADQVDKLVAPFKVKETWGEIIKTREAGLLVKSSSSSSGASEGYNLRVPGQVIGVKRGAMVMTLKSAQTTKKL